MSGSIFQGVQLLPRLSRYATLTDHLRLNNPAAARLRKIVDSWAAGYPPAAQAKIRTTGQLSGS